MPAMSSDDKNLPIDKVSQVFYQSPTSARKFKLISLGVLLFLLGFAFNFPFNQKVENFVEVSLLGQMGCPIAHDGIRTSWFFPSIEIVRPKISRHCFDSTNDVQLDSLSMKLAFPSFFPPGPRFHIPLSLDQTNISIYTTATIGGMHFNIRDAHIGKDMLALLGPQAQTFKGDFTLNAIMTLPYTGGPPSDANIHVKSTNLTIPSQNIQGFLVPQLPLNNFSLKASIKGQQMELIELIVGDAASPLRGILQGPITLNSQDISASQLDLEGNLKFSEKFLQEYSFIQLFLQGGQGDDGSYSLGIRGTLAQPNPSFN